MRPKCITKSGCSVAWMSFHAIHAVRINARIRAESDGHTDAQRGLEHVAVTGGGGARLGGDIGGVLVRILVRPVHGHARRHAGRSVASPRSMTRASGGDVPPTETSTMMPPSLSVVPVESNTWAAFSTTVSGGA